MYITITPQKSGGTYSQSSANFVGYIEKENQGLEQQDVEYFFNQYGDEISAEEVVKEIDGNTAKLKKKEPKFYSITVSPSKYQLRKLQNNNQDLKTYARELMRAYVASFNREINGRPISIDDIKYYAKIEQDRVFKGKDIQIKENRLRKNEFLMTDLLADAGYSNGANCDFLDQRKVAGWITVFGRYKPEIKGFSYNREKDEYRCSMNRPPPFKGFNTNRDGRVLKSYWAAPKDCKVCPMKPQWCQI